MRRVVVSWLLAVVFASLALAAGPVGPGASAANLPKPASATCNGAGPLKGIGIQKAGKIFYNAMLIKTSASSYPSYRSWTLRAAMNLYPDSCAEFWAVRSAWDAVLVPPQSGEPTCTSWLVKNSSFEAGEVPPWEGTRGTITNSPARPARTGSWKLWLGGNGDSGVTAPEHKGQLVTIPMNAASTLKFHLRVDTAEPAGVAKDYLRVFVSEPATNTSQVLRTYSNLDVSNTPNGYVEQTVDLTGYGGKTLRLVFQATKDLYRQTSFVIDDATLAAR